MKLFIITLFLLGNSFFTLTQINYYSDCVQGGYVGDGYTAWYTGGASTIQLPIPLGSTVKKAFLFSNLYKWQGNMIPATDKIIELNGQPIVLSESYSIENEFYIQSLQDYIKTIVVDITDKIDPSITTYTINPFNNVSPVESPLFSDFYVLVIYENPSFTYSCIDVWVNNLDISSTVTYNLIASNSISTGSDVGLAVFTSSICDYHDDWYEVFINSTSIGEIGGVEVNTNVYCAGVVGSFSYENGTLIGIGNDVGNSIMDSVDAIANIQPYMNGNDDFTITFDTVGIAGVNSNQINHLYLSYTSDCDIFTVSTPKDTTVCQGSTLQLQATTANPNATYEWQPAAGLSCSTCPNPIFTADSSMFYTVRIWNNDSCSVVRPLKINVRPQPQINTITTTPSECGANTGTATLTARPNNGIVASWQEQGGNTQASNTFSNLSTGVHTFFYTDTNGCTSADTTIFIHEITTTLASFTANPISGAAPLQVTFTNTSQNATNYEWFVDGFSQGSSLPTYLFSNAGEYQIMLTAWQNSNTCADTAVLSIHVYDSLVITIPNIFTPNQDGVNDVFSITANQDANFELVIINRWGNTLLELNNSFQAGTPHNCWNGANAMDGVYFFKLKVTDNLGKEFKLEGFLTLVK